MYFLFSKHTLESPSGHPILSPEVTVALEGKGDLSPTPHPLHPLHGLAEHA